MTLNLGHCRLPFSNPFLRFYRTFVTAVANGSNDWWILGVAFRILAKLEESGVVQVAFS